MKREQLLEAIGGVEEALLMEAEQGTQQPSRRGWRLALIPAVAAMLAISVAAAAGLFGRPITDSRLITEATLAPVKQVAGEKIFSGGVAGYKVRMEVEVDQDAPDQIAGEFYGLELPEAWQLLGRGYGTNMKDRVQTVWENGPYEQIYLEQYTTWHYENSNQGEHCVDMLWSMPDSVEVTSEIVSMAGLELLRVDIPGEGMDRLINAGGETRLYWSDGRYMLELHYPSRITDGEIETLLNTLYIQSDLGN